jgi:hypothetical protein
MAEIAKTTVAALPLLVDGARRAAEAAEMLPVLEPATGRTLGSRPSGACATWTPPSSPPPARSRAGATRP